MAETAAMFFSEFYRINGFRIEVPYILTPADELLPDLYIQMRLNVNQSLFYRPPSSIAGFPDMMDAFSGTKSWTDFSMDIFREAAWENTENGYWFWADIGWSKDKMRREAQIREDDKANLLTLEEYIIFYYSCVSAHPFVGQPAMELDRIDSWLKTKCQNNLVSARSGCIITFGQDQTGYLRHCARHG